MRKVDRQQRQAQVRYKDNIRKPKKRMFISILCICIVSIVLSGGGYQLYTTDYHNDLSLAKAGMQHLQKAETLLTASPQNLFDVQGIAQAQLEFAAALKNFTRIDADLNLVPGVSTLLSLFGKSFHAIIHLIPLAIALAQAGVTGCDILNLLSARLHSPLSAQSSGITVADIAIITQNLRNIQSSFSASLNEINQLQPADLQFDVRVSKWMDAARRDFPIFQQWLDSIGKVLQVAPTLLGIGTPANYLVEVLDSTELRPGGGFIGNYGILTLSGGRVIAANITDTYLLDHPFAAAGYGSPFPPGYSWFDIARGNLGLRDSNLEADFPTDARAGESLYAREGGDVPIQGVIAITPALIQRALVVTGPIAIPEYHETVNAQNLIARIHYYQKGLDSEALDNTASPDGRSSLRKHFTALLAEHFLARARQLASSDNAKFVQLMINALYSKDLQVYVNDPTAETLLHTSRLDAAIQSPSGDDLFVVDANISISKANSFIDSTLTDTVTFDTEGDAVHHAILRYTWTNSKQENVMPLYRDYVRVYVPQGTVLQKQDGWQMGSSGEAFGHEVWSGLFTLPYGQTNAITLTWFVPHAATVGRNVHNWHYQALIQKQAGVVRNLHLQVVLPSCAIPTNISSAMKVANKQVVTLDQVQTENTLSAIDYACV